MSTLAKQSPKARRIKRLVIALTILAALAFVIFWSLIDGEVLQRAVMNGDALRVRLYLFLSPDLAKAKSFHDYTALHWAAMDGNTAIADVLIAKGARVNASSKERVTPLFLAAQRGHTAMVKLLLKHGADTSVRACYYGTIYGDKEQFGYCGNETPLHAAAKNGHTEVVKLLLAAGADKDVRSDTIGGTPLQYAMRWNRPDTAHILLDHGANCLLDDRIQASARASAHRSQVLRVLVSHGFKPTGTALLTAAQAGDYESVRIALDAGLDPNYMGEDCLTPLHMVADSQAPAASDGGGPVSKRDSVKVVELLISRGANVNARSTSGQTPLAIAACTGAKQVAAALIRHGGKANGIHAAVGLGRTSEVKALLSAKPNMVSLWMLTTPAQPYFHCYTPIDVAVANDDPAMAAVLLSFGANPYYRFKDFPSAMTRTLAKGSPAMFTYLFEHTRSNAQTLLTEAARYGNIEAVKYLLAHGAKVNSSERGYGEALIAAVQSGQAKVVELLISKGARIPTNHRQEWAALTEALESGSDGIQTAGVLFAHGVSVNTLDTEGRNPLHMAVLDREAPAVAWLVAHGASINARSNANQTPLDLAENPEVIRILLQNGAKPAPIAGQEGTFASFLRSLRRMLRF